MTSLHLEIKFEILMIPLLQCLSVLLRFLNLAAILEAIVEVVLRHFHRHCYKSSLL
jgi:hypothetical protein